MQGTQPSTDEHADSEGREYTILVIDDEESFHRIFHRYLRGYRVLAADNGYEAVEMVTKNHVD